MRRMLFFDFDGVIADSWWLTHKTSRKVFPSLTEEEHRRGFEGNIYVAEKERNQQERQDVDYFAEIDKERHLVKFFQVEQVIRDLSKQYTMSIISSSTSDLIRYFLEREGLVEHFPDILGADVHTDKHTKMQMLLEKYELKPEQCVMITDTLGDMREARMVGIDSIAVSWGFHDIERLKRGDPFRILTEPRDLGPAIDDYFNHAKK